LRPSIAGRRRFTSHRRASVPSVASIRTAAANRRKTRRGSGVERQISAAARKASATPDAV
jgi:hypothetical protein